VENSRDEQGHDAPATGKSRKAAGARSQRDEHNHGSTIPRGIECGSQGFGVDLVEQA